MMHMLKEDHGPDYWQDFPKEGMESRNRWKLKTNCLCLCASFWEWEAKPPHPYRNLMNYTKVYFINKAKEK